MVNHIFVSYKINSLSYVSIKLFFFRQKFYKACIVKLKENKLNFWTKFLHERKYITTFNFRFSAIKYLLEKSQNRLSIAKKLMPTL